MSPSAPAAAAAPAAPTAPARPTAPAARAARTAAASAASAAHSSARCSFSQPSSHTSQPQQPQRSIFPQHSEQRLSPHATQSCDEVGQQNAHHRWGLPHAQKSSSSQLASTPHALHTCALPAHSAFAQQGLPSSHSGHAKRSSTSLHAEQKNAEQRLQDGLAAPPSRLPVASSGSQLAQNDSRQALHARVLVLQAGQVCMQPPQRHAPDSASQRPHSISPQSQSRNFTPHASPSHVNEQLRQ